MSPERPRPLVDLHRHLDGSLRRETLLELARGLGLSVPGDLYFYPGMGLDVALSRFATTLSVLQGPAAVRRVADEICQDAEAEGVGTLELRFAPQLHRGASQEAIVDAALEGAAGRAGLILCGLYGEPPEQLARLVAIARSRPGVVGLDLAGGPAPGHIFALEDYAPVFREAGEIGLGRTAHAGEGRPPQEIRVAIEALGVDRVGHGTTLLEDPSVLELVLERGVTIEACVTSNWQVGAVARPADHPIGRWLALGVPVCVCTDNTLLSQVDAPEEYRRVAALPGVGEAGIEACLRAGRAAAFRR